MNREPDETATKPMGGLSSKKHFRAWWADNQWIVIGLAGVAAFCLGIAGFKRFFTHAGVDQSPLDLIYLTLQLFPINSGAMAGPKPWELELARFLAPAIATLAAVRAVMLLFRDKLEMLRLSRWKGHVVICGLGKKGKQLAEDFVDRGERVVVIESDEANDDVGNCRERGAIVLSGSATSPFLLKKARVRHARTLFAVCSDDGTNLETALLAHRLMSGEKPLPLDWPRPCRGSGAPDGSSPPGRPAAPPSSGCCFVHVVDTELQELLARHEVVSNRGGRVEIKCFNIFENAARQLFRGHPPDAAAVEMGQASVHLLLIGFGHMGQSVALEAARVGHYANGRRVQISVVDKQAERRGGLFLHKYPGFREICDISFMSLDTDALEFVDGRFLASLGGRGSVTQAIVCMEQEAAGLVCALQLMRLFKELRSPILVRVAAETELVSLLQSEKGNRLQDSGKKPFIRGFGSISSTCSGRMVLHEEMDRMARKAHAGYVRHRLKQGCDPAEDPSMKPWNDLFEDLKESNRQQTEHLDVKLRAIGCRRRSSSGPDQPPFQFTADEVELLARMEHSRWNAERLLAGWTPGPKKDLGRKISPYLVEWEELPEEIKEFDRSTVRNIPAILGEIGEEIQRVR